MVACPSKNRGDAVVIAYVLISTEPGKEQSVLKTLQMSDGIVEIHPLFGEYDIMAKVEAEGITHLSEIVETIRTVDGIKATKTYTGAVFK